MMRQERRKNPVPGIIATAGGVLAAVGALLPWFNVFGFLSVSGLQTSDGKIMLGAGIIAAILGVLLMLLRGRGARIGLGIPLIILGLFIAGFTLYDAVSAPTGVSTSFGIWLTVIGGLLTLVGGIMGLMSGIREPKAAYGPAGPAYAPAQGYTSQEYAPPLPGQGPPPGVAPAPPPPPSGHGGGAPPPPPPPPGGGPQ